MTIAEVNKLPEAKTLLPEQQSKKILEFFENPYIVIRNLDRQTAEMAHEFTRAHGLKNMDAIHVATAVIAKVSVLYTFDSSQGKRRGLLSHNGKIGNPPLRIERPPDPHAGGLFDKKLIDAVKKDDAADPKSATQP